MISGYYWGSPTAVVSRVMVAICRDTALISRDVKSAQALIDLNVAVVPSYRNGDQSPGQMCNVSECENMQVYTNNSCQM